MSFTNIDWQICFSVFHYKRGWIHGRMGHFVPAKISNFILQNFWYTLKCDQGELTFVSIVNLRTEKFNKVWQVQSEGFLVAVGSNDGNTSMLELSGGLSQCNRYFRSNFPLNLMQRIWLKLFPNIYPIEKIRFNPIWNRNNHKIGR